jgi:hypothetical protein
MPPMLAAMLFFLPFLDGFVPFIARNAWVWTTVAEQSLRPIE